MDTYEFSYPQTTLPPHTPMRIADVICVVGRSGYFNKDLVAARAADTKENGFGFDGRPVLPGFDHIVQPGTVVSVMLRLEDGLIAFGDCVDVILAGIAGRDQRFRAEHVLPFLQTEMRARLVGREVDRFRPLAEELDCVTHDGMLLHTAVRYGLTQAVLHGASLANRCTMAEVVAREYGCEPASAPLPILASCQKGDAIQLDRMIMKRVELLPHSSFTVVERDLGSRGEKLLDYARGLVRRIGEIGDPDYRPTIHLDVYGTLGELFHDDVDAVAGYLGELERVVRPHELMIETPMIAVSRAAQIESFQALRSALRSRGCAVQVIADEWCNTLDDVKEFADAGATDIAQVKAPDLGGLNNTIEALLYCHAKGVGAYLGGSANETDQSTRVTTHVGLACRPAFMLSKPGFGGDEALMMQTNEMARTLALMQGASPS